MRALDREPLLSAILRRGVLSARPCVRPFVDDALEVVALIQESLYVVTRTGAAKPADFSKVIVDTTVQPRRRRF